MTEAHKKRLCELAGNTYFPDLFNDDIDVQLAILTKAMWAINDFYSHIEINILWDKIVVVNHRSDDEYFFFTRITSKQEALTAALIYVLDNE